MKSRPSAIWHMIKWGLGSGTILALAYLVVLSDIADSGFNLEIVGLLISPFIWLLALCFGGLPGAVMGYITGFSLGKLMQNVSIPFTKADMIAKRGRVYGTISAMTFAMSAFLIFLFFGSIFDFIFAVPPFIAAIASTYAAHRYMFRLRLWSGGIETGKVKAKNDAVSSTRLIDDSPQKINIAEETPSISPQSEKNS